MGSARANTRDKQTSPCGGVRRREFRNQRAEITLGQCRRLPQDAVNLAWRFAVILAVRRQL